MAVGTALSRATGLLRTMALASALGVTVTADAYNTANTAPIMIFTLVAGGALSAAVVPLLVRAEDRRAEVASVLLGSTLVVGAVVSALVALTAPLLMAVLTAGARDRAGYDDYVALGSSWLRMFAPQVGLYALSVLAVAIMTARRRLALGATAPVVTNLMTIAAAFAYITVVKTRGAAPGDVPLGGRLLLGWGTTAAVAAMVAIQLGGAFRSEPGLRVRVRLRHPAVRELARLGGWVVLYVIVNQIGLATVVAIANTVPGGVTAYQWGFMVMQLPYAIVAVSLLSAALPAIAARTDRTTRAAAIAGPARVTLAWLVPASVALLILAGPFATIVVGGDGSTLVAAAITGFAVSLVPFSLFQLFTRTSYALGDTRTPAFVNVAVNVVNVGAAWMVIVSASTSTQRVVGLAISHGLSYVVGCGVLGGLLARRRIIHVPALIHEVPKLALATAPVAVGLAAASGWMASLQSRAEALGGVAVVGAAGAAAYVVIAQSLGVRLVAVARAGGAAPGHSPPAGR